MTNTEIAATFARIALILDLQGENPFRIRAYERAAMMIENLPKDLRTTYEEGGTKALQELPGIGKDLSEKIEEMIQTGKLGFLTKLEKKVPSGLLAMMEIEGIGPKRTKQLWTRFKVKTLEELTELAKSGKIASLPGWGKKSVANLLRGIDQRSRVKGRLPLAKARGLAMEIAAMLKGSGFCERIEIAGSFRRQRETVGDLDFLAVSKTPANIMDFFCSLPQVESVTGKGGTKATVFLKAGLDADLRVVPAEAFGAALLYFTGSKDHNVILRRLGIDHGLTISEYGVYEGTAQKKGKYVAGRTEEDVYRSLGLPFIPPELREDRGEIEAAKAGTLPKLIEVADLQSDLHVHTNISDGVDSIEAMADAAKKKGFAYIAITDHSSPMGMVKGIKKSQASLKDYLDRIKAARKKVPGIHILAGTEVDILKDGSLYLSDEMLREFDWVVASVHQYFHEPREETTERLLKVCRNPFVHVLGHPLARQLGKRVGIEFDLEAVLRAAKTHGKAVELNTALDRLDLPDTHLKRAKELGVKVAIGSDAHSVNGLDFGNGIMQARRGWLEKKDVLNALPLKGFLAYCTKKPS